MSVVRERVYVEAPYTQAVGVFERRLGLAPGEQHGTCLLTLALPVAEGRDIARPVTARTERLAGAANYSSRYAIAWDAGRTARGIPTPGFTGTLALGAGEDYSETAIQLEGTYDPPGGIAGRAFDELIGRRFAHATLSALIGGVGDELRTAHQQMESRKQGG
ncbi:MAG TPA: hypothetical protein VFF00_06015 [Candidatus Elarobacter sp.]|nr:hypothetical protein [Dongiaceae bacterium]HZW53573.1 hypothetical protein [Candidatus Elarobacter sp.]